jgi:hypothetical protein
MTIRRGTYISTDKCEVFIIARRLRRTFIHHAERYGEPRNDNANRPELGRQVFGDGKQENHRMRRARGGSGEAEGESTALWVLGVARSPGVCLNTMDELVMGRHMDGCPAGESIPRLPKACRRLSEWQFIRRV